MGNQCRDWCGSLWVINAGIGCNRLGEEGGDEGDAADERTITLFKRSDIWHGVFEARSFTCNNIANQCYITIVTLVFRCMLIANYHNAHTWHFPRDVPVPCSHDLSFSFSQSMMFVITEELCAITITCRTNLTAC